MSGLTPTARLLRELIAIPSANPAFVPATNAVSGEGRVVDYLCSAARRASLEVELQPVLSGRNNVLIRLAPQGRISQRILLAPHLDTVGVNPLDEALLKPILKNGRLYGRGACDTKGSVAAMFTALCRTANSVHRPTQTEIIFAGLVDEENNQSGSRALVAAKLQANLAIVGEPTNLQVVTAHKGNLWLQLKTHGKAAHGACPELGRNAVHEMARIVDLLETDYAASLRHRSHPLLGNPTVNVGFIRGGTQPNIVPACCTIQVDRRTLPGETEQSVRREIKALLRKNDLKAALADTKGVPCLPMETDSSIPLVQSFLRSCGQTKTVGVRYFCDASVLSSGGIPSIVFGPGDIAQAHTSDEWISLKALEQGEDLLAKFLKSLP
jgi:acetylornithine deacetylase/succinyl-diaminopimelate desuccinylase-like protein